MTAQRNENHWRTRCDEKQRLGLGGLAYGRVCLDALQLMPELNPLHLFSLRGLTRCAVPSLMAMIYLVFCRLSAPPNIFTYYSNAARLLTVCYALDKASNDTSTRDCVTIFRVVCCAISIYIEMNI